MARVYSKSQGRIIEVPDGQLGGNMTTPQGNSNITQPQAQQKKGNFLASLLPVLGGIGGGILGIPLGPAGVIAGGAIGSGLGAGAKQFVNKEEFNPGEIATEAAWGAAGGGIGKGLSFGTRLLSKGLGIGLAKTGGNLALKGIRPTPTQLTNYAAKHGEDLLRTLKTEKLIGKGAQEIEQLAKTTQRGFDKIAVKSGRTVQPESLINKFGERIDELAKDTSPTIQRKARELGKIAEGFIDKYGNTPIKVGSITTERKKYDTLIKQFVGKPALKGANQEARDILQGSVREATKGLTTKSGQTLKETGNRLGKLYDILKIAKRQENLGRGSLPLGITNMLGAGIGGTLGNIPGAVAGLAGARAINNPRVISGLARGSMGLGKTLQSSPALAKALGVTGQVTGQGVARGIGQLVRPSSQGNQEEYSNETQNLQPVTPPSSNIPQRQITPEQMQQIYMANAQGLISDKTVARLKNAYDIEEANIKALGATGGGKKTEAQVAREETSYLVGEALQQLQRGSIATGPIASPIEELKSVLNMGDPETLTFNRTITSLKAAVAKARAGTSFTPNEEKLLNRYTPTVGDSQQQLEIKLLNLQKIFSRNQGVEIIPNTTQPQPEYVQQ